MSRLSRRNDLQTTPKAAMKHPWRAYLWAGVFVLSFLALVRLDDRFGFGLTEGLALLGYLGRAQQ